MTRHPVKSDIVTLTKLTKQRIAFPNSVRGKVIPAQSKKSRLNTSTPLTLTNVNSATHQNSKNLCEKNSREVYQRPRILQTFIRIVNTSTSVPVYF